MLHLQSTYRDRLYDLLCLRLDLDRDLDLDLEGERDLDRERDRDLEADLWEPTDFGVGDLE